MRFFSAVLIATATLANGETLVQGERDRAMSAFHASRKMFLDSVAGLTRAQWEFKAGPDRWSIAECAEHITVSEDSLFDLAKKVLSMPAPATRPNLKGNDEALLKGVVDRSHKAQAPEFLKPTHRWKTPEEMIAHFKQSRDRNIEYVKTTNDDLRAHSAPNPIFKEWDAYQVLLMIAAHSERHTLQILEVKADPKYPK